MLFSESKHPLVAGQGSSPTNVVDSAFLWNGLKRKWSQRAMNIFFLKIAPFQVKITKSNLDLWEYACFGSHSDTYMLPDPILVGAEVVCQFIAILWAATRMSLFLFTSCSYDKHSWHWKLALNFLIWREDCCTKIKLVLRCGLFAQYLLLLHSQCKTTATILIFLKCYYSLALFSKCWYMGYLTSLL